MKHSHVMIMIVNDVLNKYNNYLLPIYFGGFFEDVGDLFSTLSSYKGLPLGAHFIYALKSSPPQLVQRRI